MTMDASRWRLDGQIALVTGASVGIGRAIASELLGLGAEVLLVARDEAQLAATAAELSEEHPGREVRLFAADVADGEQRREIFDWVGDLGDGLNLLVNNAGNNIRRATMDYSEAEWRGLFETNLFSAFELARFAFPLLSQHAASAIVNVGQARSAINSTPTPSSWRRRASTDNRLRFVAGLLTI